MQAFEYINIAIVIIICFAIIEIIKIKRKGILLKTLTAYFIVAFIMFTIGNYKFLSFFINENDLLKRKLFELLNSLFSCAELIFFTSFLKHHQPSKKINAFFKILTLVYFTLFVTYVLHITINKVTVISITNLSIYLNIFEYIILFISCLLLFYSIMYKPIEAIPINKFVLIITSSLFFYISVSLSFLIIAEKINQSNHNIYNTIFLIHYLVLLLVFVSLTLTIKSDKNIFYA